MRLVGQIKVETGVVVGYVVWHKASNKLTMRGTEEVKKLLIKGNIENAELVKGDIKGTESSIKRLPIYNKEGVIVGQPMVTVLFRVEDRNTGKAIGFIIIDAYGNKGALSYKESLATIEKYGVVNGKIVNRDGKKIISAIKGTYPVLYMDEWEKNIQVIPPLAGSKKSEIKGDDIFSLTASKVRATGT